MSFFDLAATASGEIHDALLGEPLLITPQVEDSRSKYIKHGVDTSIPAFTLTGIYDDAYVIDTVKGSGANTHENADLLAQRITVEFDQRLFENGANPLPQKGWTVTRASRPFQPRYQIVTTEPDGVARVVCRLVFLDQQTS